MELKERISGMEMTIEQIKQNYVTRDRLEAEINKAKLDGVKAGAVAAVIALI